MRRLVLYNPEARGGQRRHMEQRIATGFASPGLECEFVTTETPQQATELARQASRERFEQVIAAGGDGTVNAVMNGLAGSASALGIIPLGTANVLARNIGLRGGDIRGAVAALAQGRTRRIDLGSVNGRYFGSMAGVGLDAQVARAVRSRWKRPLGKLAFVGQLLATTVRYQPCRFQVEVNDEPSCTFEEPLWAVIICNFPLYTWRLRFAPEAQPDDGRLDVVVFHACPAVRLLGLATRSFLLSRGVAHNRYVSVIRAERLQVSSESPSPYHVDGDLAGETPVVVEVAPQALDVIVPATV